MWMKFYDGATAASLAAARTPPAELTTSIPASKSKHVANQHG